MFYGEDVPKTKHLEHLMDKGLPALDFLETYGLSPFSGCQWRTARFIQSGSLPDINGVRTPVSRVITSVPHISGHLFVGFVPTYN